MLESVYRKTLLGEGEIAARTLGLPLKLRSVLIMIDGKKKGGELVKSLASLGDVPGMLGELERKGCIERLSDAAAPVKRAVAVAVSDKAKQYAATFIYEILGPDSASLVRRIELCKTMDDFAGELAECRDVIASVGQGVKAAEFYAKGRDLMMQ